MRVTLVFDVKHGNKRTASAFPLLIGRDRGALKAFDGIFELRRTQNHANIAIAVNVISTQE